MTSLTVMRVGYCGDASTDPTDFRHRAWVPDCVGHLNAGWGGVRINEAGAVEAGVLVGRIRSTVCLVVIYWSRCAGRKVDNTLETEASVTAVEIGVGLVAPGGASCLPSWMTGHNGDPEERGHRS